MASSPKTSRRDEDRLRKRAIEQRFGSGYREFERQVDSSLSRPAKSELVRHTTMEQVGQFTLGDLALQFPAASPQLIKKILAQLKSEGKVRLSGKDRGAMWEVTN